MRKPLVRTQLTPKEVTLIAVTVSNLPHRVRPTWDHVRAAALSAISRTYTRQALSAYPQIVEAYEEKVLEYRAFQRGESVPQAIQIDDEPWQRQIESLKADRAELKAKVVELDRRVALHIANAVRLGIPTRELERPTEKPYKGATDNTTGKRPAVRAVR